jgi:TorA maturation chaperone TorD
LELEFLGFLLLKKRFAVSSTTVNPNAAAQASLCHETQALFFRDHLAWWVPSFAAGLRRKAGVGFYAALGQVLGALMPAERSRFRLASPGLPLQASLIEGPEERAGCCAS